MRVTLKLINEELAKGQRIFLLRAEADDWLDKTVSLATVSSPRRGGMVGLQLK